MMDSIKSNPVGRPSGYCEEFDKLVVELGRQGKSWVEIADDLGFSARTLREWCSKYPSFQKAMEDAKQADQAFWERLMRGIAVGEVKGNVVAVTKSLQCRFRRDWTERSEVTGADGGPVEGITKIELVGVVPQHQKEDQPSNVIDISPNQPSNPEKLPEPDSSAEPVMDHAALSNLDDEPVAPRSDAELLRLYDEDPTMNEGLSPEEDRILTNTIVQAAQQEREAAVQAEQERIAKQTQQHLALPGGIGGRRRHKWVR